MTAPLFKLQIVDQKGHVVVSPFAAGKLEMDLIDRCVEEIARRGVGFGKTEAHVLADVREGIKAAIQALKDETKTIVRA